jgi:hypothetical protein
MEYGEYLLLTFSVLPRGLLGYSPANHPVPVRSSYATKGIPGSIIWGCTGGSDGIDGGERAAGNPDGDNFLSIFGRWRRVACGCAGARDGHFSQTYGTREVCLSNTGTKALVWRAKFSGMHTRATVGGRTMPMEQQQDKWGHTVSFVEAPVAAGGHVVVVAN